MPKFMKSLNIISRCQSSFRTAKLGKELCGAQHSLVLAICREPGRSQDELAKDICIDKSGVARSLASLESKGFVERKADPENKRKLLVYPTEKLLEIIPSVRSVTAEWNKIVSEGISEEEFAVFQSVLFRIEKNARKTVENQEVTPEK
ncbi:MAG: MarR family transcriptional regulator [Oscillospiraceae bacterium]|nr:MarR family transcriptional regulator [Oscillospiraceae bacterium]